MNHKNAGCTFSKAEGFSCSLDVLYGCLVTNKFKVLIQKIQKDNCCSAMFFSYIVVVGQQNPGSGFT